MKHPEFGNALQYSEPAWYQGQPSAYYNESHLEWRGRVRRFVEEEVKPFVSDWESGRQELPVKALSKRMAQLGIYGANFPPQYGGGGGIKAYDAFHSLIFSDEMGRIGAGGVATALTVGVGIGLGPVLAGGSDELKNRVIPAVLAADKFICLAVSEPTAGSDVSAIQTTAVLDPSGQFYIVNGEKKFITGAAYSDYFSTAVQTDKGISVVLVENGPGVSVRRLSTQGWSTSNTGFIVFDNVKVPRGNLLGEEGGGFKIIMNNFNGERFGIIVSAIRNARVCYEEAVQYAQRRKTFGRPLWSSQVIRSKVAEMVRRIESSFAWTESLAFAMNSGISGGHIAGQIALLKVHATQTFEYCAREASQIMGGASYLRSGPGEVVERLYREVRVLAIGGGSEEIMDDLAMRRLRIPKSLL